MHRRALVQSHFSMVWMIIQLYDIFASCKPNAKAVRFLFFPIHALNDYSLLTSFPVFSLLPGISILPNKHAQLESLRNIILNAEALIIARIITTVFSSMGELYSTKGIKILTTQE